MRRLRRRLSPGLAAALLAAFAAMPAAAQDFPVDVPGVPPAGTNPGPVPPLGLPGEDEAAVDDPALVMPLVGVPLQIWRIVQYVPEEPAERS